VPSFVDLGFLQAPQATLRIAAIMWRPIIDKIVAKTGSIGFI
jgi:hypothetical protein